jgi:alpha-ketoglutarate-dependent taurine dioxygenase
VHSFEAAQRLINRDPSPEEVAMWRQRPAKTHPLVWRHRSGRCSLVLGATTSQVEGMDAEAGRALLDELLAWSTTPERIHRHEWSVGDMVIWDNRGVLHRACPYDASSARDMHRTTIAGDEPIQ